MPGPSPDGVRAGGGVVALPGGPVARPVVRDARQAEESAAPQKPCHVNAAAGGRVPPQPACAAEPKRHQCQPRFPRAGWPPPVS